MESFAQADTQSNQQSTEPSSFKESLQKTVLGNVFVLSHHSSVSDINYPIIQLPVSKERRSYSAPSQAVLTVQEATYFTGPYL